jgi:hypothetical protein
METDLTGTPKSTLYLSLALFILIAAAMDKGT